MEIQGKLEVIAKNGKGFKVEGHEGWLNASDAVVPYLAKIKVGTDVIVNYTKKGMNQLVSKITVASGSAPKTETAGTGFVCKECGKDLKDDKYDTCYTCNQKKPKKSWKSTTKKSDYNSPERTAQIQRGNALNAASYAVGTLRGQVEIDSPEALGEATIIVAEHFLTWLRKD